MRLEPMLRNLAEGLQEFGEGLLGPRRDLVLNAAAALEVLADGAWAPFMGQWFQDDAQRVLVHDRRLGIQIASFIDEVWISDAGEVLEAVSHWRYLPPLPDGKDLPLGPADNDG
jgi:hypothetical protein